MSRSGDHTHRFVDDILDIPIPLTQDVPQHPDSLEHVDAVDPEEDPAVLPDVGDEGDDDLYVPVEAHHEEQPDVKSCVFVANKPPAVPQVELSLPQAVADTGVIVYIRLGFVPDYEIVEISGIFSIY